MCSSGGGGVSAEGAAHIPEKGTAAGSEKVVEGEEAERV